MAFGAGEIGDAVEKRAVAVGAHFRVTEFARVAPTHLAAELHRHRLHAVADAEYRHAHLPHRARSAQLVVFIGAGVAARKDDALGREVADEGVGDVVGVDFAIDMRLAHAAGDQLRDLRAEVEDEDFLVSHGRGHPAGKMKGRPRPPGGDERENGQPIW